MKLTKKKIVYQNNSHYNLYYLYIMLPILFDLNQIIYLIIVCNIFEI